VTLDTYKPDMPAAGRGRGVVHSNKRYEEGTDKLREVLRDLMHYSLLDGVNFNQELDRAYVAFNKDVSGNEIVAVEEEKVDSTVALILAANLPGCKCPEMVCPVHGRQGQRRRSQNVVVQQAVSPEEPMDA
jgi:hypothetical protein